MFLDYFDILSDHLVNNKRVETPPPPQNTTEVTEKDRLLENSCEKKYAYLNMYGYLDFVSIFIIGAKKQIKCSVVGIRLVC